MIVLDTDVVSELMKPAPEQRVLRWVDARDTGEIVITAITAAELRAGVALLPRGRRRETIERQVERLIDDVFGGYVLPFDAASSSHYAGIVAARRRDGRHMSTLDVQIAAICQQRAATLATRNVTDFDGTSLHLVNPWSVEDD